MKKTASNDALDRALTNLYQTDIPAGYQASWRDAVKREEPSEMKPIRQSAWFRRAVLPLAAAVVLVAGTLITGALNTKPSITPQTLEYDAAVLKGNAYQVMSTAADYGYEQSADIAYAPVPQAEFAMGVTDDTASGEANDDRKIVRTVDLTITTTAFDRDYAAILSLTENAGGYVASVSVSEYQVNNRTASFSLRIPSDALDAYVGGLEGIGRITNRYESATDMTTQYSDTQMRLETQQTKMIRLMELLVKAETVEDLLAIENEIADTQYQIDSLESSLLSIDRQVDYTTVSLYVKEQTPADTAGTQDLTIGERLLSSIQASLAWLGSFFENMLVFLVAASPVLAAGIILLIVIRMIRKRRKSNKST